MTTNFWHHMTLEPKMKKKIERFRFSPRQRAIWSQYILGFEPIKVQKKIFHSKQALCRLIKFRTAYIILKIHNKLQHF